MSDLVLVRRGFLGSIPAAIAAIAGAKAGPVPSGGIEAIEGGYRITGDAIEMLEFYEEPPTASGLVVAKLGVRINGRSFRISNSRSVRSVVGTLDLSMRHFKIAPGSAAPRGPG